MGTSHSVTLYGSQDSPTDPGKQSVISGCLDDLDPPVSAELFMAELIEMMKRPVSPTTEAIMKSCTVTENAGPDDFTVKLIVDGVKLDSYGYGKGDGTDRVRSWKRIVVDRSAMRLTTYDYVPDHLLGAWADEASDKDVLGSLFVQMLSGPTRIEMWYVDKEGKRSDNDDLVTALYYVTDPVLAQISTTAKAKVKCAPGKAIKNVGEESVVSEAMDEHVDYDSYFDKMLKVTKEKLAQMPNSEIEESEGKIVITAKFQNAEMKEDFTTVTINYSVESGDMTIANADSKGHIINTSFRTLHRSPLVLEAWNIARNGERSAGTSFSRLVQGEIIEVIDRANSWFG